MRVEMFNFYKLGNHFRNQKVQRRKKRKKVVFMENHGGLWTHLFDIAMCPPMYSEARSIGIPNSWSQQPQRDSQHNVIIQEPRPLEFL